MKERIINDVLMQMEPHVSTEVLRMLEPVYEYRSIGGDIIDSGRDGT